MQLQDRWDFTAEGAEVRRHMEFPCIGEHTRTTRGIDLSTVVSVSAVHSSKCWLCSCQADDVIVDLHQDANPHPLPPLHVLPGTGEDVAELIRMAVEEEQTFDASHHKTPNKAPPTLSINRSM